MNVLPIIRTKHRHWLGCRPLTAAERMAQYSARLAAEMQRRENEGAALPRVRVVDGRPVLIALTGRVNTLPKDRT